MLMEFVLVSKPVIWWHKGSRAMIDSFRGKGSAVPRAGMQRKAMGQIYVDSITQSVDPTTRGGKASRSWQARGPWEAKPIG